ncbi:MAG: SHOCT domain-containing protein [Gammaproteobacteria bacterium]|nr:SHOCT domain-containing protein [Gammaproteobacteria bacterium]
MIKPAYIFLFVSSFVLLSCSSNVETFNSTRSLGTQLDDLNKAYSMNAITEEEYKKAKEILIDHYQ